MQNQRNENLLGALTVIREAPGRIAELHARQAPAEEIATEEDLLRNSEEVRAVLILKHLRETADAKAAELLLLDARRRELVAVLQTYPDVPLVIGGQTHRTIETRRVNVALELGLDGPDVGAFDDARRGWQIAADELLRSHDRGAAAELQEAGRG